MQLLYIGVADSNSSCLEGQEEEDKEEKKSRKEPLPILDVKTFIREKLLNAFDLDS